MYEILPEWHLPVTDHTLPVLLNNLENRGLLQDTLAMWVGEFGRTPNINKNISRDHWPRCCTALLAGGGVKGGAVYGASDKYGAVPDRDPVTTGDLRPRYTTCWASILPPKFMTTLVVHYRLPTADQCRKSLPDEKQVEIAETTEFLR